MLITSNQESARLAFPPVMPGMDCLFRLTAGARYLGGFVGDEAPFHTWLAEKTATWTTYIDCYAEACVSHPHSEYCGIQQSLQHEW